MELIHTNDTSIPETEKNCEKIYENIEKENDINNDAEYSNEIYII